jgi:DnaJ-class molecular chaperone
MRDYYAMLGVQPDADENSIKTSFRILAKRHHPDMTPGDPQAEERFKEINKAWEILGDKKKRAEYDKSRIFAQPESNKRASAGDADIAGLMGKFETFFGKGTCPDPVLKKRENPLDASGIFEQFMGIKKNEQK